MGSIAHASTFITDVVVEPAREPRPVGRTVPVHEINDDVSWTRGKHTLQFGGVARFGKTYAGEPDRLVEQLRQDEAIAAADTLLLTIPNQLGVDYCAHVLESLLTHVAPELGWSEEEAARQVEDFRRIVAAERESAGLPETVLASP